jgi:hypothetical protein
MRDTLTVPGMLATPAIHSKSVCERAGPQFRLEGQATHRQ